MARRGNEHHSAFEHQTKYEKLKIGTWALGALVAYIILAAAFPLPAGSNVTPVYGWTIIPPNGFWVEARAALGGALITFCAFGAFMELLNYKSMDQEVGKALTRVFGSSTALISNFNGAEKREFVENTLEALLGESIGMSTFDYIKPMLNEEAGFRTDYEYNVFVKDGAPDGIPSAILDHFDPDSYRWIRESMTYKLMKPAKTDGNRYSTGPFSILFLFDKTSLELLNPKQEYFARFLIELNKPEIDWLLNQEKGAAEEAFKSLVQPEFWEKFDNSPNEQAVDFSVMLEEPEKDPRQRTRRYFKVSMKGTLAAESGQSRLRVGFTYPYRRSSTHFIFTMPQPVFSPSITFNYNQASITDVDYASYYSVADPTKSDPKPPETDDLRYEFKVNGCWVFPTSGITMVWKNKDRAEDQQ